MGKDSIDREGTLVLFAHPALERARIGPAMVAAATSTPGVALRDLYELYPDFTIDVAAEQNALCCARAIVLQFPFYWYSTPALLKEWLDLVLTHGFAYGARGRALEGRTLACAISTGGPQDAYADTGQNLYSIDDFLRPLEQTARLCRMGWAKPFVVHGAAVIDEAAREATASQYSRWLADLGQRR